MMAMVTVDEEIVTAQDLRYFDRLNRNSNCMQSNYTAASVTLPSHPLVTFNSAGEAAPGGTAALLARSHPCQQATIIVNIIKVLLVSNVRHRNAVGPRLALLLSSFKVARLPGCQITLFLPGYLLSATRNLL